MSMTVMKIFGIDVQQVHDVYVLRAAEPLTRNQVHLIEIQWKKLWEGSAAPRLCVLEGKMELTYGKDPIIMAMTDKREPCEWCRLTAFKCTHKQGVRLRYAEGDDDQTNFDC